MRQNLVRTNSTGLTIYNPSNLANMIKGMKNKNQTREDKIKARIEKHNRKLTLTLWDYLIG